MKSKHLRILIMCILSLSSFCVRAQHLDQILFGDTTSTKNHGMTSYALSKTEVYIGTLGQKALRLLPNNGNPFQGPYAGIYGGEVLFEMKIDSTRQNYFTVKFSGDEINGGRIILNVEGKELGSRHGGDEEIFFEASESSPGAFFYRTAPIPRKLTDNKTHITIRMRSSGSFYAYGIPGNYTSYQKALTTKTCGLYRAYSHTNPSFPIPADDIQGSTPNYNTAPGGAADNFATIKAGIIQKAKNKITELLNGSDDIRTTGHNYNDAITLLAQAYELPYNTVAYHNPAVIAKIKKAVDRLIVNSNLPGGLKANGGWGGAFGRPAFSVALIYNQITGLDSIADLGGGPNLTRREQWIRAFKQSLDAGAVDRRTISNQTLDASISFYGAALGLAKLDPVNYSEFPKAAVHYVLEAVGIEQFSGTMTNLNTKNPILGNPATSNKGAGYYFMTPKGGSHEPGWVSIDCYGNLAHSLFDIWTMTKADPNVTTYGANQGDTRIMDLAVAHNKLQTGFTYPWTDDGKKAILAEGGICWRNAYIPGKMHYGAPIIAGVANDPDGIGYMKQMASDGNFIRFLDDNVANLWYHYLPMAIDNIIASNSNKKIPSTPGETANVVSDEENGVLSIHRADEHIFIALFNRASSDNKLCKAHHVSASVERKVEFKPDRTEYYSSGSFRIRSDNVTGTVSGDAPDRPVSGYSGQKEFYPSYDRTSKYNPDRGIAELYQAQYGKYYIAMNTTRDLTKTIEFPAELVGKSALEISTGATSSLPSTANIPPSTTRVYYISSVSNAPGLIPDTRPEPTGVTKSNLLAKITEVESFVVRDTVISKVSTSPLTNSYKYNLFADVMQQLSFSKFTFKDTHTTQAEADTAQAKLNRAYIALIGDKYTYATNTLVNGTYYIKVRNTDLFLTKNSTTIPLFDTVNVNTSLQRWKIMKDGARYKMTAESNGAYLNEGARFGTNAYTSNWHTMNIYTSASAHAIQRAGLAGNNYWLISGNQILTNGAAVTAPSSFPFELVLYIYADIDAKIAEARAVYNGARVSAFAGELGTYPQAAKNTFLTAIENAEANRNSLTTIQQVTAETATLNTALINFKKTYVSQRNQLANGTYYLKFNNLYYTTPVGFNAKDSLDLVSQQWQFTLSNNVGYHIMSIKSQTYFNENGNASKQASQLPNEGDWARFNIYFDGTKYAIQKRAPGQSTQYFNGTIANNNMSATVSAFTDPALFIFNLVPAVNPQNITFSNLAAAKPNDPDMALNASSSSGLPVTYTSSDTTVAKILAGKIKILKAGISTITAWQSGNTFFKAATPVSKILTVKSHQTITFGALPAKTTADTAFSAGASSSAGLMVAYLSSDTTVAKILNGRIHLTGAGISTITAMQPGDSLHLAAAQVQQILKVKALQTISFPVLEPKKNGDPNFDAGATSNSGLAITYSSSNAAVATILAGKIHIAGSGTTTITAAQLGDSTYTTAVPVSRTLLVKAEQVLTFNALSPKIIGDPDFALAATTSSGLPLSYTSSNPSVAQINGNMVQIGGAGNTIITVYQGGDSTYTEASKSQSLSVTQPNLAINYVTSDYNQPTNNTIKPDIQLVNNGNTQMEYKDITIRYWLTAENYSGVNTWLDYAQIGSSKIKLNYVQTTQPMAGANGYIEYSFDPSSGTLNPGSSTGPIRIRIANKDWTALDESDDHSYISTPSYLSNDRITIYRNGKLIAGKEPETLAPEIKLSVHTENKNTSSGTNTISTWLKIKNEGNLPLNYSGISVRYWFTQEGAPPLNFLIDYAKVGNSNIIGQFIKVERPLNHADTYLEIRLNQLLGKLYPLSSTGNIQYRISKNDWSAFNELNDHSYLAAAPLAENPKVTAYYDGQLIFGTEPEGVAKNSYLQVAKEDKTKDQTEGQPIQFIAYPNPFSNSIQLKYSLPKDDSVVIRVSNAVNGNVVYRSSPVNLKAGEHTTPISFEAQPGNYILSLEYGGKIRSALIFKQ